ncbi:hypothetical protein EK21DRAFT_98668 [Setomelanomma holmii]|uniref:Kelch repeat protein n=1 Tax=Setomelanomma holmii TaxID=210430 RepID=A0A9P4HFX0_9PLEO|nr:hypothetical protein EK21DRAFT_98668 [Setomelanomma holmii]
MRTFCWLSYALVWSFHTARVAAQVPSEWKPFDVITYFCARWYHQAVVKNDVLYLYGGIETFNVPNLTVKSENNTLGYNPFLLENDLTQSWDWKTNISWTALAIKSNPATGDYVRHAMTNGAMYHGTYNTSEIWTYSGTTFRGNQSFLDSDKVYANAYPLFSFNNDTQVWNQYDLQQTTTPSYGLSTEAPDQGLAFYLSGQVDNGTEPYTRTVGDSATLLNGMMVIDLVHQTARNISITMQDPQPRIGGHLQYLPAVGSSGVLIALGGRAYDGIRRPTSQDKGRLITFDSVDIFDIGSYRSEPDRNGTWYQQKTSGEIPPPRIDACTVVGSAPDNSSHNIYMFGGWNPTKENTWYDEVYVLSLPSFIWVKMYYAESPRYGHTCHAVGRQMITTGGHNIRRNVTDYCDWELHGIAVLDIPTMTWGSVFNATLGQYEVSTSVVDKIGGTPQGGSTKLVPEAGWSSSKLGALMNTTRIYTNLNGTIEVRHPRSSSKMSSKRRTAIIVGVAVPIIVIVLLAMWLTLRWRKRRAPKSPVELPADQSKHLGATELGVKEKHELAPDEKHVYEMSGEGPHEAADTLVRAEADRANTVQLYAAELPATNVSADGRWGVPFINTQAASRRGSEMVGGRVSGGIPSKPK